MTRSIWIFGGGYWASILIPKILRTFRQNKIYISDINSNNLSLQLVKFPETKAFDSDTFIKLTRPGDIVFVLTPPHTHFDLCKQALSLGCHVWCEKPLTMNSKESQELIEIAQKNNQSLFVDNTFLFDNAIKKLVTDLKNREKIIRYHSTRKSMGKVLPGVGVVWDLLPHDLSILTSAFGEYSLEKVIRSSWIETNDINVLAEVEIELRTLQETPLYISLSSVNGEKTRHINTLHTEGISCYSMTPSGSVYEFYTFCDIPGLSKQLQNSPTTKYINSNEPLLEALKAFQNLIGTRNQHPSLTSNVAETRILEEINKQVSVGTKKGS